MTEAEKIKVWEEYSKTNSQALRESLILEYAPLVKIIAGRLSMCFGYNADYEDLVSYGIFGLIDAIDKFDYCKGIKFETYASLRIRGAILDQVREMDWLSRTMRKKQKTWENALQKLETELGRKPTDEEVAEEMEISLEEVSNIERQSILSVMMSLEECLEQGMEGKEMMQQSDSFSNPEHVIEQEDIKRIIAETLETLTEKEKRVIVLYYYEERGIKEISRIMEVSACRVSQLHTRGLQKLKARLGSIFI